MPWGVSPRGLAVEDAVFVHLSAVDGVALTSLSSTLTSLNCSERYRSTVAVWVVMGGSPECGPIREDTFSERLSQIRSNSSSLRGGLSYEDASLMGQKGQVCLTVQASHSIPRTNAPVTRDYGTGPSDSNRLGRLPHSEHRGAALLTFATGGRPAVLHRHRPGTSDLAALSTLQTVSDHCSRPPRF